MCLNYKNNEDIHFSIFLVLPYYSKLSSLALFPSTDKHSVYFLNKPTVHRVSSRFILIVKTCTSQHKDIRVNSLSHCGFFFFFFGLFIFKLPFIMSKVFLIWISLLMDTWFIKHLKLINNILGLFISKVLQGSSSRVWKVSVTNASLQRFHPIQCDSRTFMCGIYIFWIFKFLKTFPVFS